jgi:hypothetical protein
MLTEPAPNMRVQRPRSSPSAPHSPLTRRPLGGGRRCVGCTIILAVAASACSSGPTLEQLREKLAAAAGPTAVDCGVVMLGNAKTDAVNCSVDALSTSKPFYVAFQVQGIDSTIVHGLAVNATREATSFMWDSDKHGGRYPSTSESWIAQKPCVSPSVKSTDRPISCS